MEGPVKYELIVNLKTAKALGLAVRVPGFLSGPMTRLDAIQDAVRFSTLKIVC